MDMIQVLYRLNAPCVWWFLAQLVAGDDALVAAAAAARKPLPPGAVLGDRTVATTTRTPSVGGSRVAQSLRSNLRHLWLSCVGGERAASSVSVA